MTLARRPIMSFVCLLPNLVLVPLQEFFSTLLFQSRLGLDWGFELFIKGAPLLQTINGFLKATKTSTAASLSTWTTTNFGRPLRCQLWPGGRIQDCHQSTSGHAASQYRSTRAPNCPWNGLSFWGNLWCVQCRTESSGPDTCPTLVGSLFQPIFPAIQHHYCTYGVHVTLPFIQRVLQQVLEIVQSRLHGRP